VVKGRLAVVAALNEMVRVVGDDDASSSEHARKVAREGGTEAINKSVTFFQLQTCLELNEFRHSISAKQFNTGGRIENWDKKREKI